MAYAERVRYAHRQTGWVMLVSALLPFLCLVVIWSAAPETDRRLPTSLVPLLCGFSALAASFSWLTVRVDDSYVAVRFGIGLFRRTIAVSDIVEVAAATTRWYAGWGIRITRQGMLYNIGGFDAVRLRLVDGRSVRIGSDEPERLLAAIRRATAPTGFRR